MGIKKSETLEYGETVQMKLDHIIPVFRCQIIETIIPQYCRHWSFHREILVYQLHGAQDHESMGMLSSKSLQMSCTSLADGSGQNRSIVSHSVYLSRNMVDDRNCKVGIIKFPVEKTLGGQIAQTVCEIKFKEEFAKVNKHTYTITLSSCLQTRVSDKSMVDGLLGTLLLEYDLLACPQMVVKLCKGLMKIYTN